MLVKDFSPKLEFERLTVDDGLPSNRVSSILQDVHGFMWFGTEKGLVKLIKSLFYFLLYLILQLFSLYKIEGLTFVSELLTFIILSSAILIIRCIYSDKDVYMFSYFK